ncbi:MAG TPA: class I SAM-dependent methyltransferase, partial [Gemmataceae bacterium]|nr:class I SAM-dependent methyltransferase [Gemmataceae bacterium]
MIADTVRTGAYARALREAIKPSSVVLDIGSGTGVFSLLACQYGARRVYAIEPSDAITIAQAHAQANGCADRIQFIHDLSTKVTLPERVDVLVSDIRGILPFHKNHLPSIVDARKRFLRPGGTQIPLLDKLWAAPVDAPADYARLVLGHHPNALGLNMEAALRTATNNMYKVRLKPEHLLAGSQCWMTLDYTKVETSNCGATLTWIAPRSGTCQGIVAWFETLLAEG